MLEKHINRRRRLGSISVAIAVGFTTTLLFAGQASGAQIEQVDGRAPECQTKHLAFYPHGPTEYYWAWVANFEVNGKGQTTSCVMLFQTGNPNPVGSAQVPCMAEPADGVTFSAGKAIFRGGHLKCDVNLKQLLPQLAPIEGLSVESHYDYNNILIAVAGTVDSKKTSAANPVLVYKSAKGASGDLTLALPTTRQGVGLTSIMNGTSYGVAQGSTLASAAKSTTLWQVHYLPRGDSQAQVKLSVGNRQLGLSKPVAPVRFHMDGGTFYIGGMPNGPHFIGTLDEVVVDPPDGGRPPNGGGSTGP